MDNSKAQIIDKRATLALRERMLLLLRLEEIRLKMKLKPALDKVGASFEEFTRTYADILLDVIKDRKFKSKEDAEMRTQDLMHMLNNIWQLRNTNEFVIDIEKALELPDVRSLNSADIDVIADCFVSFTTKENGKRQYTNLYFAFSRDDEHMSTSKKKDMVRYSITVGYAENKKTEYQLHFTTELLPRLFKSTDTGECKECKRGNSIDIQTYKEDELVKQEKMCLIGNTNKYMCYLYEYELNPQKVINILAYIATTFKNRNTLLRKNSASIRKYNEGMKIDVVCDKDNTEVEVPLLLYVRGENKEYTPRRGKNHGTHRSPREHMRREHTRTLKSGKVIKVRGCIVNKGKEKTIYKV